MREIIKDSRFKWLAGLVIFFSTWFILENIYVFITKHRVYITCTYFYQVISLYGSICGFVIAQKLGGLKTLLGRAILFFSLGLFFQVIGQSFYSYYWYNGIDIPYPSLGDIGYFGSIPLYIYGTVLLSRVVGTPLSINSIRKYFQSVLLLTALLVISYVLFLRDYVLDLSDPIKTFLDFGYPIGDAIYVTIAVIILTFSYKNFGKNIRRPVTFILLALLVQYIADYNFLYQVDHETWVNSGYGDYIYLLAYLAMAFALLQFRTTITFPISNFSQLAQRIIEEQERVVGPLAWEEAQQVKGISVDPTARTVTFSQAPRAAIDHLLQHYETIFGRAAREASRGIVKQFYARFPAEEQPAAVNAENHLEYINENLYRHNLELATKNKTLALLRQLHGISLLALKPQALANTVVKVLQTQLGAETVALLAPTADGAALQPLALAESAACGEIRANNNFSFAEITVPLSAKTLITDVWQRHNKQVSEQFANVWNGYVPPAVAEQLVKQLPIRSSVAYPLASEGAVNGVLLMSLNRFWNELPNDEQEMINSTADVVAAALRQALLYEQLTNVNRDLKKLNEQQSQFLTDIAHELQSPLTIVSGNVEALAHKYSAEENTIQMSRVSLQRLSQLITNLLLLARADFGMLKLQRSKQDICQVLHQLYEETETLADMKDITYNYNCATENRQLNIDAEKIKGACLNILSNAFKYTPNGGTVTMNVDSTTDGVCVRFFNSGGHISTADMQHLFERFYRRAIHEQEGKKGTGLGLAIAKTVIEEHGGTITVRNIEPDGVEFTVTIPNGV